MLVTLVGINSSGKKRKQTVVDWRMNSYLQIKKTEIESFFLIWYMGAVNVLYCTVNIVYLKLTSKHYKYWLKSYTYLFSKTISFMISVKVNSDIPGDCTLAISA